MNKYTDLIGDCWVIGPGVRIESTRLAELAEYVGPRRKQVDWSPDRIQRAQAIVLSSGFLRSASPEAHRWARRVLCNVDLFHGRAAAEAAVRDVCMAARLPRSLRIPVLRAESLNMRQSLSAVDCGDLEAAYWALVRCGSLDNVCSRLDARGSVSLRVIRGRMRGAEFRLFIDDGSTTGRGYVMVVPRKAGDNVHDVCSWLVRGLYGESSE